MRITRGHLAAAVFGLIAGAVMMSTTSQAPDLDRELALEVASAMRSMHNLQLIEEGRYASVKRQTAAELRTAIEKARRLTDRGARLNHEGMAVRGGDLQSLIPLVDHSVASAGLPAGVAHDFRAVVRGTTTGTS